ncbi:MAG: phage tail protein [Rhodocyclales bacterium]|nr:phage tail protein [Rhodocyclales bacterium]
MRKPIELRAWLTERVPHLRKHPDKLHVFIDKGSVATKRGAGLGFEYRYTLQIVVTDYADPPDTLTVPLLVWISTHQPDLIDNTDRRDRAIGIDAEIIDHKSADIGITLELSERVLVKPVEGGGYECEHLAEPEMPDLGGPSGWEVYLKGELIYTSGDGAPPAP